MDQKNVIVGVLLEVVRVLWIHLASGGFTMHGKRLISYLAWVFELTGLEARQTNNVRVPKWPGKASGLPGLIHLLTGK